MIPWQALTSIKKFEDILQESYLHPVLIFKHSTRCSISSAAKDRLERQWKSASSNDTIPYYLDILAYREVSNKIANDLTVEHQSPQVVLIIHGRAVYNESHMAINFAEIASRANV